MFDPNTTPGAILTERILAAVAPIIDGEPSDLVLEAMAGAMMAAVTLICKFEHRGTFLDRYAGSIATFRSKVT